MTAFIIGFHQQKRTLPYSPHRQYRRDTIFHVACYFVTLAINSMRLYNGLTAYQCHL
jgi:hypothetical protein